MSEYRLDRTNFKAQTVEEAADHATYFQKLIWQEQAKIAHYLNSIAFNFPLDDQPRMDKTKFEARARD